MLGKFTDIFGPGFPEVIYQRALRIEMEKISVSYLYEFEKDIYYEDNFIGNRRLDFLIDNKVLLELKATSEMENKDYNQIINYLRVFRMEVGLLLNFGSKSLQYKRFVNSLSTD
ncbi:MAG: GxxExxY protein [Chitinophagaceae bacterium]